MSLYGKYRPQNFANLVGQDHIRETILHEIQRESLTHAYLFTGPRGTGKTSSARLIAKALNCTKKTDEGEPCDECEFCKTIKDGSLIDVVEIDAASNRGIDEIRDLKEKIQFAPTRAKTKLYIIDEVHMLTKEAFNALLKTLEEPPENVYFILCTTEVHKIPETIISRCQRFDFKRIDVKTIMTRLSYIAQLEGIQAEDEAIELIARHVEGGLRDAIGLLEQMTIDGKLSAEHIKTHLGITGHQTINTLIDLLVKKETVKALHTISGIHNEGYDLNTFVREILECLRDKLISGIKQGKVDSDIWLSMIAYFEEARDMLRNAIIPELPLEIAVIKICGGQGQAEKGQIVDTGQKAAVPSEEKATQAEEQTVKIIKKEYEQDNWPRVLEHIQPPSLKRSLSDAKVVENEDKSLTLCFNSQFHMEKVNTVENHAKIEDTINHIFGRKIKIDCRLEIQKETASTPVQKTPKTAPEDSEKKVENITKRAMEIFGSEN